MSCKKELQTPLDKDLAELTAKLSVYQTAEEPECRTGFVYDEIMTRHKDPRNENHVENPTRITFTYETLHKNRLLQKMVRIPARVATVDELNLVHSKPYIESVRQYKSSDKLTCDISEAYPTYVCGNTYETAAMAAGSCLNLMDSILSNQVQNGFALVRPPGHHAGRSKADGFCFFNNVAIVARHIQKNFSSLIKKILIFDWDIHHGNGTQEEFYEDDVLYISIHRHEDGQFYPGLSGGRADFCGSGKGRGYNVNIPWASDTMGNEEYMAVFNCVVLPIVRHFQPDVLLISAGFDAAEGDPLGEYQVTPEAFGYMTGCLKESANGRVMLILEGGYNSQSLGACVSSCVRALTQNTDLTSQWCQKSYQTLTNESAKKVLREVVSEQFGFWPVRL